MTFIPHPFSLRQLQYAIAVCDERNFRRAAERCHVSQPSLSAQLAQLESALDVRLFERDRRRVLLTQAGDEVVKRARRVLLETDDLVESARRLADPLNGKLRIGVIPTVSPYVLPYVAPALHAKLPRLSARWTEDKTDVLVRQLEAGVLDAALLAMEAPLGDVESVVIAIDPFVLAAPAGDKLASRRGPAKLEELSGSSVLLLDDGHCLRDQALSICSAAHARELEFRATSLPTLSQMVASGAGVTLLPLLAVGTENRNGDLVIRRFADPAPHRTLGLIWRRRSPLGPAIRELGGIIRATCEKRLRDCRDPAPQRPPKGRPPSPVGDFQGSSGTFKDRRARSL